MEKQISVLIIEDYEDDAELMVLELNKSGLIINYEVVDNENALKDALLKKKWDAIISDYKLPGFNAIGALKTIQQMKLDLPFIIVSGTIGEEIAVQAMKSGAQDYIMKSNLTRLAPALEREIREAEMRLQKKVSAEKLLEQELLLRSVVEFLPVGLVLIDRNKNIVLANKEFRNTWGNIESFNGPLTEINIFEADTGKSVGKENWAVIKAIDHGIATINEILQISINHTNVKTVLNSVVPIIEEYSNTPSYAIMLNQDITKLKEDEARLKNTLLELERSNRDLEQFAYVASHDLQEPLRMIASFTQLLSKKYKEKLDSDADQYIDFAVNGAKRMQELINDLLNYSRTTNYNKLHEKIDLNILMISLLDDMKKIILDNCADITIGQLPEINANQRQLRQLFQNLISNAIKFRKEENPVIHIDCKDQGENWLFSVKDNGIGIDSAYHQKIFTIFQRLHNNENYPGTGIGLALCKKIIEQLGGTIWIESDKDNGSAFYFTIPKK